MSKLMLIDAQNEGETRVVISDEDDKIIDFDFITAAKKQIKSNIYLAKVTRVEPSLQAAFVEYGGNRQGFLPFSEIHPDYYQIPVEDKKRLLKEEEEEAEAEEAEEEAREEAEQERREKRKGRRRGLNRRDKETRSEEVEGDSEETFINSEDDAAKEQVEITENNNANSNEGISPADDEEYEALDDIDEDDEDEVETITGDDEDEVESKKRGTKRRAFRRYKIQEVIKRNQVMLVQVIKEERGNKGCSMSTYISLPGRYCVLMPNAHKGGGVSRKITNREDRKRLKEMMAELKDKYGMNAIIRTAGSEKTRAEIRRDFDYLIKMWNQIREDTMQATAPALIYEEGDVIKRSIRDLYTTDIEEVLIDGEEAYKDAKAFMKILMPSHAARVKRYKGDTPLYYEYDIENQLDSMYEPEVKLPSGGYIVIHPTEALISIDVNSGRSTTERSVEETALKTNCEAAEEVARQLRLRDLAGLVVIDFIDMYYGKNRRIVEKTLRNALKVDRAKIQLSRLSMFGLMELSRQRLRSSISETAGLLCPHCNGMGTIKSNDTVVIQMIRIIQKEASTEEYKEFRIFTNTETALHLLNHKREMIQQVEEQYNVKIVITVDHTISTNGYRIIKVRNDGSEVGHDESKAKKNRRRGGKGRHRPQHSNSRNRNEDRDETDDSDEESASSNDNAESESDDEENEGRSRRRGRSRGNRGGRNRRSRDRSKENSDNSSEENQPKTSDNDDQAADSSQESTDDAPKNTQNDYSEPVAEETLEEAHYVNPTHELHANENGGELDPKDKKSGWWNKITG